MRRKKRAWALKVKDPERTVRARLTFVMEIATIPDDCLEVLADALAGDLLKAARDVHRVEAECTSVKINGKALEL